MTRLDDLLTMTRLSLVILVLVGLAGAGCKSNTSPSDLLTGTWNGTLFSVAEGPGTARVTFNQSGSSLSGTWLIVTASGQGGGTLSGTVNGSAVSAVFEPSIPTACPYSVTGTVSGNRRRLTGTYATFLCTLSLTGTFDLERD